MLNDDYGVAPIHQLLQDIHQNAYILEVQARCRLIQNIEGLAGVTFGEFGCKLHTLALTTRKSSAALSELNVSKPHLLQALDFLQYIWHVLEKLHCLVYGHVEHVGYRLAFITHLQRLTIVAFAMAHLARHRNVGQEVHFYHFIAISATSLTASAFHIEREAPGLIAPYLSFRQVDKQAANVGEHARVCRGIGAWRPPNRTLVNVHHLVDSVYSLNLIVRHRLLERPV